jgi:ATP-dependent RNA helicase RhlE
MSFETLGLSQPILRAIVDAGYTTPTPIQLQAIPAVMSGRDLLAGAQTGTGKTAGFTLPILQRLSDRPAALVRGVRPIRTLILTPTRELAAQVEQSVKTYGKYLPIKSTVIFGGVGQNPQVQAIRKGVDILVATPGRLLDLHQQRACDLSQVEIFVLDEADRMLDMGFVHDIKKVLAILPNNPNGVRRQNLLYSATFSDDIKALADRLLDEPQLIEVARRNTTAQTISQKIHFVDRDKKRALLSKLISEGDWKQVLVFTRTKFGANRLADQLSDVGITAMAIHGNKSQGARTKALADFKAGSLRALVATDIAARGIDIDQLPYVVNYDLPNVPEDYVHRIGRTGRAGALGHAVSLVTVDETNFLSDIERLTKQQLTREVVPGFEADMSVPAEPVSTGRQTLWGAPKPRGWVAPPKVVHGRGGQNHGGQNRNGSGRGDSSSRDASPRNARPEGLRAGPRPTNSPSRGATSGTGFGGGPGAARSSGHAAGPAPAKSPSGNFAPRPATNTQNRPALTGARPAGGSPPSRSAGTGRTMSFGKLR